MLPLQKKQGSFQSEVKMTRALYLAKSDFSTTIGSFARHHNVEIIM